MLAQPLSPAYTPWSSGMQGVYGLGQDGSGERIALTTVSSAGTIMAGTAPLWTQAAWAIPVIGGIVAGVALALTAWFNRKGPKQKVQTTKIVNELEPMLQENLRGYQQGPHTVSSQAQALANFDAVWNTLVENCELEQYGDPGKRCIADRKAGSCQWQEGGTCWNWFVGYRDPIANDPNVRPDPLSAVSDIGAAAQQLFAGVMPSGGGLLLVGAVALVILGLTAGGSK